MRDVNFLTRARGPAGRPQGAPSSLHLQVDPAKRERAPATATLAMTPPATTTTPLATDDVEEPTTDGSSIAAEWRAGKAPEVYDDDRADARLPLVKEVDRKARTGKALFKKILHPATLESFEQTHYQRGAFVVKRRASPDFWTNYFGETAMRDLVSQGLRFGESITLSKIVKGTKGKGKERVRVNLNSNLDGSTDVAKPEDVWHRFRKDGCSMRILHPQRWNPKLLRMIVALEEYFECLVGCNLYYTPPGAQGFAAHYDDVDVLVLQVKGKKTWSLFPSRSEEEILPLFSSRDFREDALGRPAEVKIAAGDFLYLPRGAIHRARTHATTESLHLTISANRLHTWANLLELALPEALREAAQHCVALRRTPPRGYFHYTGACNADVTGEKRQDFVKTAEALAAVVLDFVTSAGEDDQETPIDHACDLMSARFQEGRMFPLFAGGSGAGAGGKKRKEAPSLREDALVQVRKANCCRLVIMEDRAVVFHSFNNTITDHASGCSREENWSNDPKKDARLEFEIQDAGLLEEALGCVKPRRVGDFPAGFREEGVRAEVLTAMVDAGILEVVGDGQEQVKKSKKIKSASE